MKEEWRNLGARDGLYYLVSNGERVIRVALLESADTLVGILNALERDAAFGRQCIQDDCEGAWIAATVHNELKARAVEKERKRNRDILWKTPMPGNWTPEMQRAVAFMVCEFDKAILGISN